MKSLGLLFLFAVSIGCTHTPQQHEKINRSTASNSALDAYIQNLSEWRVNQSAENQILLNDGDKLSNDYLYLYSKIREEKQATQVKIQELERNLETRLEPYKKRLHEVSTTITDLRGRYKVPPPTPLTREVVESIWIETTASV